MKFAIALVISILILTACESVDDHRIPSMPVRIEFPTVGDWQSYGVAAALDYRSFIKGERIPGGFPYPDMSATGFGGVLLVCSFDNVPLAYDLSCPVEISPSVRVSVDTESNVARCFKCGSTYDVYRTGAPLSGPASEHGYALTRYNVSRGQEALQYMIITR
ncbi:MAG: hypothetical protein K2H63_03575 [Paramuribaculum sp.]|nr:hypothetical protein [Paramuribaculum sp.]